MNVKRIKMDEEEEEKSETKIFKGTGRDLNTRGTQYSTNKIIDFKKLCVKLKTPAYS